MSRVQLLICAEEREPADEATLSVQRYDYIEYVWTRELSEYIQRLRERSTITRKLNEVLERSENMRLAFDLARDIAFHIGFLLDQLGIDWHVEYDLDEWPESELEDLYVLLSFKLVIDDYDELLKIWEYCIKEIEGRLGREVFRWVTIVFDIE